MSENEDSIGCKGVARVGDLVQGRCECCGYSGTSGIVGYIATGSDMVLTNSRKTARCGDLVKGYCGHEGHIVTCSKSVFVGDEDNCLGIARCGDLVGKANINGKSYTYPESCIVGKIVTCSKDVFAGD